MFRKIFAILLSIAINGAVLVWLAPWGTSPAAGTAMTRQPDLFRVLPVVTVRPTPAQLEMLRCERLHAAPRRVAVVRGATNAKPAVPACPRSSATGQTRNG